ncbi:MAG: hypothetical protein RIR73_2539, partial [Chloroflexota bacterium]
TDGELFPDYVQTLRYDIFPKKLQILLP